MDIKPQIGVRTDLSAPDSSAYLARLAERLNLPLTDSSNPSFGYLLTLRDSRLEVHSQTDPKASPLTIDFLSGRAYYRFIHDRRINQPLAKAAGVKSGYRPTVLDATAGFGEDAFVLASLGCMITMIERSEVIWALLADAISRCRKNEAVQKVFDRHVTLKLADSIDYLNNTENSYDTVFLDPMYPSMPKSPLNKQKMRMLRELVGNDSDGAELLTAALLRAHNRVAVKRPARARHLDGRKPSFIISSKSSRYDIYLIPYL